MFSDDVRRTDLLAPKLFSFEEALVPAQGPGSHRPSTLLRTRNECNVQISVLHL